MLKKLKAKFREFCDYFRCNHRNRYAALNLSNKDWDRIYSAVLFCYGDPYVDVYHKEKEEIQEFVRRLKGVYNG